MTLFNFNKNNKENTKNSSNISLISKKNKELLHSSILVYINYVILFFIFNNFHLHISLFLLNIILPWMNKSRGLLSMEIGNHRRFKSYEKLY
jgi:hypothetical protein